jgi:hypothetical protein
VGTIQLGSFASGGRAITKLQKRRRMRHVDQCQAPRLGNPANWVFFVPGARHHMGRVGLDGLPMNPM